MCLVVFLAASVPLPLVPWRDDPPAFNVTELTPPEQAVRAHFSFPNVVCAGAHTRCGCGFNDARQFPGMVDKPEELANAIASARRLASYVREHGVSEIYACWSGDEGEPKESERHVHADDLAAPEFMFTERELLVIAPEAESNR